MDETADLEDICQYRIYRNEQLIEEVSNRIGNANFGEVKFQ